MAINGTIATAFLSLLLALSSLGVGSRYQASGSEIDGTSLYLEGLAIAEEQGHDAADAWVASLSPSEKEAFRAAFEADAMNAVVEVSGDPSSGAPSDLVARSIESAPGLETDGQAQAAASACYGPLTYSVNSYSKLTGAHFYRYSQQITWCVSGNWVTDAWCSAWPSETGWGYSFSNHLSYCQVTYGGVGYNLIRYFSQGSFCAGVGWCMQNGTPWIWQQGDHTGLYTRTWGG